MSNRGRLLIRRLTLKVGMGLSLGLVLFAVLLYQLWAQTLIWSLDDDLQRAAEHVRHALHTQRDGGDWISPLRRLAHRERIGLAIVVDGQRHAIAQIPETDMDLPELARLAPSDHPQSVTVDDRKLRVYLLRHSESGDQILLGRSWRWVTDPLHRMRELLLIGTPLVLLAGVSLLWVLLRRATAPLIDLIGEVEGLAPTGLRNRVSSPRTGDELEHLADSFNDLLARLEVAFDALQRFSYDASHELQTPLARLRSDLEVTLLRDRPPEEYRETLARAIEETDRIAAIVKKLLELARFDAGQVAVGSELIALEDLFAKLEEWIAPLVGGRRLRWRIDEPLRGLSLMGDAGLLQTALWNLLDNALKFGPSDGVIEVAARFSGQNRCELVVRNSGSYLDAEQLDHIAQPFYRVPTKHEVPGFGLGLSLCERIAKAHGGGLRLRSWNHRADMPSEVATEMTPPVTEATLWLPHPEKVASFESRVSSLK
ncbi:Histidine kinase [Sulfidibacter corallicola]|uniref:histidine kinase n=1 Tax=Sulfidibacter corallicola TaxID=2818388 RepID=A0A8A4TRW1_SULCO|nr:ATP-binding protein [Sulfidibacter corallicola]QTD51751.1 hypothetical protein J3U87_04715 [Sulfidibacter corallicola]